jgi:cyclic pyranopterin monophosphate synthase
MKKKLTHTDSSGNARMVDVGSKPAELRFARAGGFIRMQPQTVQLVRQDMIKKGDVLKVAEIAGIQAAKQTPALIPLCHPVFLTRINVTATIITDGWRWRPNAVAPVRRELKWKP